MAVLDDLKKLKHIASDDTSQDDLFNIYIRRAVTAIGIYLNVPTVIGLDSDKNNDVEDESANYPDMPQTTTNDDGVSTTTAPVDIATAYPDAVIEYVLETLNRQGDEGVKQSSMSSVQMTYEEGQLSDAVKALLPTPTATMVNTREQHHYYDWDW